MRPFGLLPNEALQQTRSAFTTIAAALAAERRCSTDVWFSYGLGLPVTRLATTDHGGSQARC
jgi:hypothetical protein